MLPCLRARSWPACRGSLPPRAGRDLGPRKAREVSSKLMAMLGHESGSAAGVSRGAILQVLRSSQDAITVDVLTTAVGLTRSTVRFHLDRLIKDGLATGVRGPASGPGRPKRVYRAVPPEAVDGEAGYRMLAGLLADELARLADPLTPISAGRAWAARVDEAAPAAALGQGESAADYLVRRVVRLFERGGFAPEIRSPGLTIELHRCPFMDLARARPDIVCGVHLGLVRGLVDRLEDAAAADRGHPARSIAAGVRVRPALDGSGPCLVQLPGR
jgi:predicted ArsR family transcriptional regulator